MSFLMKIMAAKITSSYNGSPCIFLHFWILRKILELLHKISDIPKSQNFQDIVVFFKILGSDSPFGVYHTARKFESKQLPSITLMIIKTTFSLTHILHTQQL